MPNTACALVAIAFLERDGQVLLTRRPAGTHLGGYWEFPGGKVAVGETLPAALRRELREEVGIDVAVGAELAATTYAYPDRCVALHLFRCTLVAGEPAPRQVAALRWVPVNELHDQEFPPANAALLAALRAREE